MNAHWRMKETLVGAILCICCSCRLYFSWISLDFSAMAAEGGYLTELLTEKDNLDPSFVHSMRLLTEGKWRMFYKITAPSRKVEAWRTAIFAFLRGQQPPVARKTLICSTSGQEWCSQIYGFLRKISFHLSETFFSWRRFSVQESSFRNRLSRRADRGRMFSRLTNFSRYLISSLCSWTSVSD